jgi:hypothetical protein
VRRLSSRVEKLEEALHRDREEVRASYSPQESEELRRQGFAGLILEVVTPWNHDLWPVPTAEEGRNAKANGTH